MFKGDGRKSHDKDSNGNRGNFQSLKVGEVKPRMQLTPIHVESYAGHKADETPRRFLIGVQWMEIVELIDRWYQIESQPEWPRANYFKVRATDGHDYLLKHDQEADEWFLGRSW